MSPEQNPGFEQEQLLPPHLRRVARESWELGTRQFTVSQDARTLRVLLEPEPASVQGLSVFLSYTTSQEEWAQRVALGLRAYGFDVRMLDPVEPYVQLSDWQISSRIQSHMNEVDMLCFLFSVEARERDWVRFEFAQAAWRMGRVLLVHDSSVGAIEDFQIPKSPEFSSIDVVRHTLLAYDADNPLMTRSIAVHLINDPDEGITDGSYRPRVIRERVLLHEHAARRTARSHVGRDPAYLGKNVVDVIPLPMEERLPFGDTAHAVAWLKENHGRLNLQLRLLEHETYTCAWERVPISQPMETWAPASEFSALVIMKKHWDGSESHWSRGML